MRKTQLEGTGREGEEERKETKRHEIAVTGRDTE